MQNSLLTNLNQCPLVNLILLGFKSDKAKQRF